MKPKTTYICEACGAIHSKWSGKCEECGAWNTISENVQTSKNLHKAKAIDYVTLESKGDEEPRITTKIKELDRVLGGGIVHGATVLIGGEPGVGKSTLLLQLGNSISSGDSACLYISGEESTRQIALRASRLGISNNNIKLASTTSVVEIIKTMQVTKGLSLVVIDSIQTMYHEDITSAPGTVSQVRQCAFELIREAKKRNIALLIVGHITKEGQIAGPKLLEHMVDTVLYFEGEINSQLRIVRAVKNRFGASGEIGVFEMEESGLVEVSNPSASFLQNHNEDVSGCSIYAGIEGTRPILLEIQALTVSTFAATPRRAVVGWDANRLAMIIAILGARLGIKLADKEVYLNVAGGLKITEPAADLAVAAALISAFLDKSIPNNVLFIGEVGLSGEVRQVPQMQVRIQEAQRLGFNTIVMPKTTKDIDCQAKKVTISHIRELKNFFIQ